MGVMDNVRHPIFDPLMYYMCRCHWFLLYDVHLVYLIFVSDFFGYVLLSDYVILLRDCFVIYLFNT